MTTPIRFTGFNYGMVSSSGGGLFDAISGVPQVQSTYKHSGSYAMGIAPLAEVEHVGWTGLGADVLVGRLYFMFPSLPISYFDFLLMQASAGSYVVLTYVNGDSKVKLRWNGQGGTLHDTVISTYTWYRLDFRITWNANPRTIEWKIDGVDGTTQNASETSSSGSTFYMGTPSAQTGAVYYDDAILSATSGDYPIGAGETEGIVPSGDGTHNAGFNIIEDQDGYDIGLEVTAYDLLDELPMNSLADYVRQSSNGSQNYAEVLFGDTSNTNITAVRGVLAYHSASTNTNKGACIVIRNDSTEIEIYGTPSTPLDMSETSLFYKSAIITPPGGGWTQSEVNALKAHIGHASDANPDPYWDALMLEVAYVAGAPPTPGVRRLHLLGVGH